MAETPAEIKVPHWMIGAALALLGTVVFGTAVAAAPMGEATHNVGTVGGRERYGDFVAGSIAYVTRSAGSAFNVSRTEASGSGSGRATGTFCGLRSVLERLLRTIFASIHERRHCW